LPLKKKKYVTVVKRQCLLQDLLDQGGGTLSHLPSAKTSVQAERINQHVPLSHPVCLGLVSLCSQLLFKWIGLGIDMRLAPVATPAVI
jgi:hypothetical protein